MQMSTYFTLDKLSNCLLQRVPVYQFAKLLDLNHSLLSDESQYRILALSKKLLKHNAYYIKLFLKAYIACIEKIHGEVIDSLYELYCDPLILNSVELSATDIDTIEYSVTPNDLGINRKIIIKENPKIISGSGTTGFRTWEAALLLSNYLNSNKVDLNNKSICELGTGTGLVGLSLAKIHHKYIAPIKEVVFTDGDSHIVERLSNAFILNKLEQADPKMKAQQLVWGTTTPGTPEFVSKVPVADIVVAADVTYDSSILESLASTIEDFFISGAILCLVAATVRNEKTIEDWESVLQEKFKNKWEVCHSYTSKDLKTYSCWFSYSTPEIRIYQILR